VLFDKKSLVYRDLNGSNRSSSNDDNTASGRAGIFSISFLFILLMNIYIDYCVTTRADKGNSDRPQQPQRLTDDPPPPAALSLARQLEPA
jgi:hypothetical protein